MVKCFILIYLWRVYRAKTEGYATEHEKTDKTPAQACWGRLTYTDLAETAPFFAPLEKDAWGFMRRPFSPHIARLSAELAADVYGLATAPWEQAGWADSTFVVEDKVIRLDTEGRSKFAALETEWRRYRAKSLVHGVRPVGDLLRAARQVLVTDMGKSLIMTRALADGRVIIAISFMGTTEKFYDWYTNFKFQQKSGMHYGFLEMARQFTLQAPRVALSQLSGALSEPSFTLQNAIELAAKGDDRFTFWLSGHSQGGALVQTYAHLLMQRGVSPEKIVAYSLAAPSVAAAGGVNEPGRYPVFNIINADDLVPRVGAEVRLGVDCLYRPLDAFRAAHYRLSAGKEEVHARVQHRCDQVQSTLDAVCFGVAAIRQMQGGEAESQLTELVQAIVPQLSLLKHVGLAADEIVQYLDGKLMEQARILSGGEPEHDKITRFSELLADVLTAYGGKPAGEALYQAIAAPHILCDDEKDDAFVPPYIAIVRKHLSELEMGIWRGGLPALCENAKGERILPKISRILYLLEKNGYEIENNLTECDN